MTKQSQEGDRNPFTEWIDDTHKKFTIIGIFGGLSVYLTQIPLDVTIPIQAGIAGSLLIFFLLTSLIILEGVEKALDMVNDVNPELFLYIFTVVGLVGIQIAVVSVIDKYSQGAAPLVDAALTVGISFYYVAYFFVMNPFSQIEQDNLLRLAMAYSPHIGAAWILLTEISSYVKGEQYIADFTWDPYVSGTLVLVFTHFVLMVITFTVFTSVEYGLNRVPLAIKKLRSHTEIDKKKRL